WSRRSHLMRQGRHSCRCSVASAAPEEKWIAARRRFFTYVRNESADPIADPSWRPGRLVSASSTSWRDQLDLVASLNGGRNHSDMPALRSPSLRRLNCCWYFWLVSLSGTGERRRKLSTVTSGWYF